MSTANTQSLPILADVKLCSLPFYNQLAVIMPPTTLIGSNPQNSLSSTILKFNLTPKSAQEISINRFIQDGIIDYAVQVQLRICLCDSSTEQNDCYPLNLDILLNSKEIQLPPPLPTRPGCPIKRTQIPLNLTNQVKISPTVSNKIEIRWKQDPDKNFAASVYLVRKLDTKILMKRLSSKVKPDDFTRGVIKEKFQMEDGDQEIKTVHLRVSLICPLGKIRFNMPCRASTCTHLQCFDANTFLHMNEKKSTWKCPVCDQPALYENLLIDGYFLEVINSPKLASDENEILLHKDGSWSSLSGNTVKKENETKAEDVQVQEISSDDEESKNVKPAVKMEEPIVKKEEPKMRAAKKTTPRTASKTKKEVETPVRKRQPSRRPSTRSNASKKPKKNSTDENDPKIETSNEILKVSSTVNLVPRVVSIDLTLDDD